MMHWSITALLVGAAAHMAGAQDLPGPDGTHRVPTPCDVSTLESGFYCIRCEDFDPGFDCGLSCESCGENLLLREACVRTVFECSRCNKVLEDSRECGPGHPVRSEVIRALVSYRCEGCESVGASERPCKEIACERNGYWIRRTCAESGNWPHGGTEPVDYGRPFAASMGCVLSALIGCDRENLTCPYPRSP